MINYSIKIELIFLFKFLYKEIFSNFYYKNLTYLSYHMELKMPYSSKYAEYKV